MKSTLINIGVLFLRPACQCRLMRYHTQSRLSEHMFETPEGFLLCPGVAIARTGPQPYAADEVADDVEGFSDVGVMLRDEDEVFDSEAMASFEGKPLVIDHPDEDVNPDNWKELAVGHVQNVPGGRDRRRSAHRGHSGDGRRSDPAHPQRRAPGTVVRV